MTCSHFARGDCQSCSLMLLERQQEIKFKQSIVSEISATRILPLIFGEHWGFRHKVKLHVSGTIEKPIIGLPPKNISEELHELIDCPLHHPFINQQLVFLKRIIYDFKLTPYDIKNRKGELKGLILFTSSDAKESYIRFIVRSKECLDRLRLALPQLKQFDVVSVNIQPIPHAIMEGEEEIVLTQKQYVTHKLNTIPFYLHPRSFVQTNPHIAAKLYATAAEWVQSLSIKTASDIYCGSGGFALHLAKLNNIAVTGYEINDSAIASAKRTSQELALSAEFHVASSSEIALRVQSQRPELLIVNPPRKGLAESLQWIGQGHTPYLLYSSCSPDSLKSDLQLLAKHYIVEQLQGFDMFPHSSHLEILCLLMRPN